MKAVEQEALGSPVPNRRELTSDSGADSTWWPPACRSPIMRAMNLPSLAVLLWMSSAPTEKLYEIRLEEGR